MHVIHLQAKYIHEKRWVLLLMNYGHKKIKIFSILEDFKFYLNLKHTENIEDPFKLSYDHEIKENEPETVEIKEQEEESPFVKRTEIEQKTIDENSLVADNFAQIQINFKFY